MTSRDLILRNVCVFVDSGAELARGAFCLAEKRPGHNSAILSSELPA